MLDEKVMMMRLHCRFFYESRIPTDMLEIVQVSKKNLRLQYTVGREKKDGNREISTVMVIIIVKSLIKVNILTI